MFLITFSFSYKLFETCVCYIHRASQFGLAKFQVLSGPGCQQLPTMLDSTGLHRPVSLLWPLAALQRFDPSRLLQVYICSFALEAWKE